MDIREGFRLDGTPIIRQHSTVRALATVSFSFGGALLVLALIVLAGGVPN